MRAPQKEGDDDYLPKEEITARLIEQHRTLQRTNQELTIKLEKQRINDESELNLERKHHEKTTLELNKTKHQNRELKRDIQDLEAKLQQKDREIEDLKSQIENKGGFDHRLHERDSVLFHKFMGKSPVSSNIYDTKVMSLIRVYQDKLDQQEQENRTLNRELTALQQQLSDREEELLKLKKDFGQTYEQLSKEVLNRVALLENENKSLTKDNQALREGFERLESERNILKAETLELSKKLSEMKSKQVSIDITTPNKGDLKYGNSSSPQTNKLRVNKSLTTSKKMPEDKFGERDERFSAPRESQELSLWGLGECRRLIAEIIDTFNLRTPSDILPTIKKTEKIMQAIPKLQNLLEEIAGLIFSRSGPSSGENHIELIVPYLKNWANSLDELDTLKEFKAKLIGKLALRRDSDNISILKNIDDLMYVAFQHEEMRMRTQRDATENSEQKAIFSQLKNMLGTEPTVGLLKQMMIQRKDVGHFIDLVKTQLNLDSEISNEACFTHLLKYIGNAKKDRQAGYILNRLQEILGCSVDNVLPTVEEMISERRSTTAYGVRRHFKCDQ